MKLVQTINAIPRLAKGYTREEKSDQEIRELYGCNDGEILRRAMIADKDEPDSIKEETILFFVRKAFREKNIRLCDELSDYLIRRIYKVIYNKLSKSFPRPLSIDERDELVENILNQVYMEWYTDDSKFSFWEARFWFCLNCRICDQVTRCKKMLMEEVSIEGLSDPDSDEISWLDRIPSREKMTPEITAMVNSALRAMKEPYRSAFYLRVYEDYSEKDIAKYHNVSERTIRNWLCKSKICLEKWRDEMPESVRGNR